MLRLQDKFKKEIIPAMIERFGYKSVSAVPKIEKVVINTGFGRQITEKTSGERKKISDFISQEISLISGQRPVLTQAKKSISGFKLREGMLIGAKVTLRGEKMYSFLDKIIHVVLPRSRDFQGINLQSVDEAGNLTIAIKEHIAFPEIQPEKAKSIFGLEITIVTTTKNREEGLELFKLLGFPIKN